MIIMIQWSREGKNERWRDAGYRKSTLYQQFSTINAAHKDFKTIKIYVAEVLL